MTVHLYRNIERSVYFWLKDIFSTAPFVNIVDAFPSELLKLPTIAVEVLAYELEPLEMGTRQLNDRNIHFTVEIFAETKTQRDDYAYLIMDNLEERIPVYDFNYGFPPTASPPQIGVLLPYNIKYTPIKVFPELTDKMYWRGQIYFFVNYEET